MNRDEKKMIEDMRAIIQREHSDCMSNLCENCEYYAMNYCGSVKKANALHNAGCRIIGDDEIVIKKQAYEKFVEEFAKQEEIAHSYEQGYTELLEANHQLQDELEKTKQQTAREILQEILYTKSCEEWFENEQLVDFGKKIVDKIENLANKYGIELE